MSSGLHPAIAAEKLDVRKYLFVLRRRKWWGIVPFTLLALAFGVICLAVPAKYSSTCLLLASKASVDDIYARGGDKAKTSQSIVSTEMLRYDRVMVALEDTNPVREIEQKTEGDPAQRSRLKEKFHQKIIKNTRIDSIADVLIRVSYLGESPDDAYTILNKLITNFVENAIAQQQGAARRAKELAQAELVRATEALESAENAVVSFLEDHPGIAEKTRTTGTTTGKRESLQQVIESLDQIDRDIAGKQRQLATYREQLDAMPKQLVRSVRTKDNPAVTVLRGRLVEFRQQLATKQKRFTDLHPEIRELKDEIRATEEELARAEEESGQDEIELEPNVQREKTEEKKLELEASIDYQEEARRNLQLRKTRLEEEVNALPGLQRELKRLDRQRDAAAERYDVAVKRFKQADQEFNQRMEGTVLFSVFDPPRKSHQQDIRHIVKLALMGLFVSLAAGIGAIAGTEFLDQSFTDVEAARDFLRLPSLGVIPLIETPADRRSRLITTIVIIAAVLVALAALVLAVREIGPVNRAARDIWAWIVETSKDLM